MSTHEPPTGPDPQDPDQPAPPPYGSTSYPPPSGGDSGFGGYPPTGGGEGGWGSGGYPPPPPPGSGHSQPFSPTDAIAYGWSKFVANPGQWLIAGLAVFAVSLLASAASWLVTPAAGPFSGFDLVGGASTLVSVFITLVISGFAYRGALDEVEGRRFDLADTISRTPVAPVVLTALLLAAGITVGMMLFLLPGLVFAFLSYFAMLFVVDQAQSPVDALSSSVKLVSANLGQSLLLALLSIVVIFVATCPCGLGLFVAYPVLTVAVAYAYRRFQDQPVA